MSDIRYEIHGRVRLITIDRAAFKRGQVSFWKPR